MKMNLATVISVIVLALIVFFAVRYIVKEKKRGVRCIGCPAAGTCAKHSSCGAVPPELSELADRH